MRVLFIGEAWFGSCARSLREALARRPDIELDDLAEDAYSPAHRAKWLRGVHRLLARAYRKELADEVLRRVEVFQPHVIMAYKGASIDAAMLRCFRSRAPGAKTVNVYPDFSPHAHGQMSREAVGCYDLVISTKPFHPGLWQPLYGYANPCRFVPQGYDPALHLVDRPPDAAKVDVALVATWRAEYHRLMVALAHELNDPNVSVAIGGNGWAEHRADLPAHWSVIGALQGQSYIRFLRSARVCVAPVMREVIIGGRRQPGDEDTTRSYELAAAHCFFIHRRTPYIQSVYDEATEVPMFDDATELAAKIRHFLAHPEERAACAAHAYARAVPAYSLDARAGEIVGALRRFLSSDAARP